MRSNSRGAGGATVARAQFGLHPAVGTTTLRDAHLPERRPSVAVRRARHRCRPSSAARSRSCRRARRRARARFRENGTARCVRGGEISASWPPRATRGDHHVPPRPRPLAPRVVHEVAACAGRDPVARVGNDVVVTGSAGDAVDAAVAGHDRVAPSAAGEHVRAGPPARTSSPAAPAIELGSSSPCSVSSAPPPVAFSIVAPTLSPSVAAPSSTRVRPRAVAVTSPSFAMPSIVTSTDPRRAA